MAKRRCINNARLGQRCTKLAAKGFDYCKACGRCLSYLWIQTSDEDRVLMRQERKADQTAAKRRKTRS